MPRMDHDGSEDIALVRALLAAGDEKGLDAFLSRLHPADIADVLQELDPSDQPSLLKRVVRDLAAEVLTEIDRQWGQSFLLLISDRDVVELLGEMQSDEAADIMGTLPAEKSERVEALLPDEDRTQIQELTRALKKATEIVKQANNFSGKARKLLGDVKGILNALRV